MTEEQRNLRDEKMKAISAIRRVLLDGNTWAGKTLHETICLIDDTATEAIGKIFKS